MTFDKWIEKLLKLRRAEDKAARALMDALVAFEAEASLWRAEASSFDEVLKKFDICRPERYRAWVAAREVAEPETIERIGKFGALQAARITDPKKRAEAVSEMDITAKDRGVPLSKEGAAYIAHRYQPPTSNRVREISEVDRLKARVRELEKMVAQRDKTIADLRARLTKGAA